MLCMVDPIRSEFDKELYLQLCALYGFNESQACNMLAQ
jgi:hypothetical protein